MIGVLALRPTTRARRGFTIGIAAGLGLPIALLLGFSLLSGGGDSGPGVAELTAEQEALTSFEDALAPVIEHGAALVVYGMRPGINDIYDQRFDDETLSGMAAGWVDATERLRSDFADVEIPGFLSDVGDLYRQAFEAYHDTARALHAAATTTGDARTEHINEAAEHGTRADQLYNTAAAELDKHRQRLGLRATDGGG